MSGATFPSPMISLAMSAHRRAALSQSPVWSSLMHRTLSRSRTYCEIGVLMPCMESASVASVKGGSRSLRSMVSNVTSGNSVLSLGRSRGSVRRGVTGMLIRASFRACPLRFFPSWSRTMQRSSSTAASAASLMRERNVSFLRTCWLNALRLNTNLHRLAMLILPVRPR